MGAGKVFSDELIQDVERNHGVMALNSALFS